MARHDCCRWRAAQALPAGRGAASKSCEVAARVRALRRACAACGIVILHVADRVYNEYVIHCAAENVCGLNGPSSTQYIPFECNLYTVCISFYFICISFVYHLYVMVISAVYDYDPLYLMLTSCVVSLVYQCYIIILFYNYLKKI